MTAATTLQKALDFLYEAERELTNPQQIEILRQCHWEASEIMHDLLDESDEREPIRVVSLAELVASGITQDVERHDPLTF